MEGIRRGNDELIAKNEDVTPCFSDIQWYYKLTKKL